MNLIMIFLHKCIWKLRFFIDAPSKLFLIWIYLHLKYTYINSKRVKLRKNTSH